MTNVLIGCGPFPPRRDPFLQSFDCVEVSEAIFEPIRHNTLRSWRDKAREGFHFVLGASRWLSLEPLDERDDDPPLEFPRKAFGLFRDTEANRALWAETRAQADALAADAVFFRSPTGFSPSVTNLDALRAFRRDVIGDVPFELVWEPRGIWQADELDALGAELGITIVRDPHAERAFPDPVESAYYAVTAPSGHLRFSEDDLFDLSEFLDAHTGTVRVVFRGPDRERNARQLINLRRRLRGEEPIS